MTEDDLKRLEIRLDAEQHYEYTRGTAHTHTATTVPIFEICFIAVVIIAIPTIAWLFG